MMMPSVESSVRSGLARSVSTPTRRDERKTGLSIVSGNERARRGVAGLSTNFFGAEFRRSLLLDAERARDVDAAVAELRLIADDVRGLTDQRHRSVWRPSTGL